jgi:hypothetical protein
MNEADFAEDTVFITPQVSLTFANPQNMMVTKLPAYCPELNPTEHIWDEIREKFFPNLVFESMDTVEEQLMKALFFLEKHPATVQSITGFKRIVNVLSKGKYFFDCRLVSVVESG